MATKRPDRDSVIILKGDTVRFELDFDANFPQSIRFEVDGEEPNTRQQLDSSTAVVECPFIDAGDHEVWMAIEAIEDYILSPSPFEPDEMTTMVTDEANWNVFCMERDELYTTPTEELKEFIGNLLMLYSAGSISKWALLQAYEILKDRDETTQAEQEKEDESSADVTIEDVTEGDKDTESETNSEGEIKDELEEAQDSDNDEVTALPEFRALEGAIESEGDGTETQ